MWHEARKQERKIRGMLVDYRKRAERRQDFYEKIKADPTQFMQIHGRKCKIHLDPAVAAAGDGSAIIVPWQGQQDNLIDRFDVRAHLDYIPSVPKINELEDIGTDERQCNYERYRILAQNDFLGIPEDKFLHQLYLEEQFGANAQLESERGGSKKKPAAGVAIGYIYDTDAGIPFSHILSLPTPAVQTAETEGESDSEVDMDVSIEISKLDTAQAHELNACGRNYGMKSNDFYSFLTKDADEADAIRMAREEEQEKIMLSGRKSRRERRAQRERRFAGRPLSPPSYAAKEEPISASKVNDNESDSRSPSPENSGKITYITSFGGEDELHPHSKISINIGKPQVAEKSIGPQLSTNVVSYADKVKKNLSNLKEMTDINRRSPSPRKPMQYLRGRSYSLSRSRKRKHSRTQVRGYKPRRSKRQSSSSSCSRRLRDRSRSSPYHGRRRSRSQTSKVRYRRRHLSSYSSSSSSLHYKGSNSKNLITISKSTPPPTHLNSKSNSISPSLKGRRYSRKSDSPHKLLSVPPLLALSEQNTSVIDILNIQRPIKEPPEVPVKRYYGRKRDNGSSSSDELINFELDEHIDTSNSDQSNPLPAKSSSTLANIVCQVGKSSASATATSHSSYLETKVSSASGKQNLRDRLKRKMQMLLNKQYKADKKAEIERTERQIQQQQEREDEMRELALKLRRRQRELRHKYGTPTSTLSKSSKSSDSEHDEMTSDIIEKIVAKQSRTISRSRSHEFKYRSREKLLRSRSNTSRNQRKLQHSRSRSRSRRRSFSQRQSRDQNRDKRRDRHREDRNDGKSRDNRSKGLSRDREYNRYRNRDRERNSHIDRRDQCRSKCRISSDRVRDLKDNSPKLQRRLVDY